MALVMTSAAVGRTTVCINKVLPEELLSVIFSHFTVNEQVEKLSLVCYLWREIIYNGFCGRSYLKFNDVARRLVRDYNEVFNYIRVLDVKIGNLSIIHDLARLFARLKNLTDLHIVVDACRRSCLNWRDVADSLHQFQCFIESLSYTASHKTPQYLSSGVAYVFVNYMSLNCPESMAYLDCRQVNLCWYDDFITCVRQFINLRHLDLRGCSFSGDVIVSQIFRTLNKLTYVDLRCTNIPADGDLLENISHNCPHIQFLGLSSNINVSSDSVCELKLKCVLLRDILIHQCQIKQSNLVGIIKLLQICTGCKILGVIGSLNPAEIQLLSSVQLDTIEELSIDWQRHVSDDLVVQISMNMPNLRRVDVHYCQNLTNVSIQYLVSKLTKLERLRASWINNIDSRLLGLLAATHRGLGTAVRVIVRETRLSEEMVNLAEDFVVTGINGNIYIEW